MCIERLYDKQYCALCERMNMWDIASLIVHRLFTLYSRYFTLLQAMDILDHALEPLFVGLKFVLLVLWGAVRAILPESLLPHKPIKDEIVLVTGASAGLGRLIALAFARCGARLVLLDINECGRWIDMQLYQSSLSLQA